MGNYQIQNQSRKTEDCLGIFRGPIPKTQFSSEVSPYLGTAELGRASKSALE